MDASEHHWFTNDIKVTLHAVIDDATGTVLEAYFDQEEILNAYYEITRQLLTDYGIPYEVITDNRTVFNYESKKFPP